MTRLELGQSTTLGPVFLSFAWLTQVNPVLITNILVLNPLLAYQITEWNGCLNMKAAYI